MHWTVTIALSCMVAAGAAVLFVFGIKKQVSSLSGWLSVPFISLFIGFVAFQVGFRWALADMAANPANDGADGPQVFVAALAAAMILIALPATISACVAGALTLRQMSRRK
jgi:uncharacterized membrane protein